ncbi:SRPBCC family protein [Patulibacter minatonensis]|uniref:SRPBCC family protein n=1 Tax=Patulibacter minatonensis TaxID=298163 RepID=UPI00047AD7A6|nr:SRPBCC family protein [Patulibacter minatonensis]
MPKLLPADEAFLTTAPAIYAETFDIALPASEVWAQITADDPLAWCSLLKGRWTSERPFGVGTTRQMRVAGLAKVQEHFFVWEEGRRKAFYLTSANVPVFERLAEDYVVEPAGDDRCTFTWTIAVEPSAIGKAGGPLNSFLFGRCFKDTRKHFPKP